MNYEEMEYSNQKIDAPPHLKRCGLKGARFLDAQSADSTLKCGVFRRHFDINIFVKILFFILTLLIILFLIRLVTPKYLDDVHPDISCDDALLQKADTLYIIPRFNNHSIADNHTWCAQVLELNKTLALHGVYHTYNEFAIDRSEKYLRTGVEDFKKCFGVYPTQFKSPQMHTSHANTVVMRGQYSMDTWLSTRFHKVYHCDNKGMFPNWVSDLI